MKTIGMLGGMSFESTLDYYKLINEGIRDHLNGSHSAKIFMYSYDYAELEILLEKNEWADVTNRLVEEAINLRNAGADFLVLCANTMHIVSDLVEEKSGLKIVHIVKSTLEYAKEKNLKKVLLLGTIYTMKSEMYPTIFKEAGITVITPNKVDQAFIHRTIYLELIRGILSPQSKERLINIIKEHQENGVDGVILGCTELPLLIKPEDIDIDLMNTLKIHAKAVVEYVLVNKD
ncbi:MAG: amino acid racemase [Acholeplasmataceae bacterium]|nr:amino acid racemase [Acholeplasmataceae bacterium]